MSIQCENCGAFYRGSVSPYQKFVKCQHCGSALKVPSDKLDGTSKKTIITETVVEACKTFKIDEFAKFLTKRGITTYDPVSGILKLGPQQVCINDEGTVEGPEPLRSRVERWIQTYMSS